MTDSITFRTTDLTRWGVGQNSRLSKTEIDINFWVCQTRLIALEDHAASAAVGISDFFVDPHNPTQFYEVLTDSTQLGPFTLPTTTWTFTNPPSGQWIALSSYAVFDVFTSGTTLYSVLVAHTSGSTFDAGATDGHGHSLYQVLFAVPSGSFSTVQTQTAGTWTPVLADAGTYNRFPNGTSLILPLDSVTHFPVGTEIHGRQAGSFSVTIEIESGGTLNHQDHCFNFTSGIGATFTVKKVATNEWDLFGRLETGASP